ALVVALAPGAHVAGRWTGVGTRVGHVGVEIERNRRVGIVAVGLAAGGGERERAGANETNTSKLHGGSSRQTVANAERCNAPRVDESHEDEISQRACPRRKVPH